MANPYQGSCGAEWGKSCRSLARKGRISTCVRRPPYIIKDLRCGGRYLHVLAHLFDLGLVQSSTNWLLQACSPLNYLSLMQECRMDSALEKFSVATLLILHPSRK